MKLCTNCKEFKQEDEFYFRTNNKKESYRCKVCKECKNKKQRERRKLSFETYLKDSMRSRRWSAKSRGIEFNLDEQYCLTLFKLQGGICPYTNIPLDHKLSRNMNSRESISLDRWDCNKGYIKGNVMYISGRANVIKNNQTLDEFKLWMPTWFEIGSKLMEKINDASN